MTPAEALSIILECIELERFEVLEHFRSRLAQRGLFWADVLAVIENCSNAREDGIDLFGRPRWLIKGKAADDFMAELLAVLDRDDEGNAVVFITIYFED